MVITQNGRAAAVVLTPEAFEELGHRAFVRSKIGAGIRKQRFPLAVSQTLPFAPFTQLRRLSFDKVR